MVRERCSALFAFEYEQSPWINQAESWCHRGHLFCLALFRLLHSPAGEKIHSHSTQSLIAICKMSSPECAPYRKPILPAHFKPGKIFPKTRLHCQRFIKCMNLQLLHQDYTMDLEVSSFINVLFHLTLINKGFSLQLRKLSRYVSL